MTQRRRKVAHPCPHRGCRELVVGTQTYCNAHRRQRMPEFYKSAAWKRLRASLIAACGSRCQRCDKRKPSRDLQGHHVAKLHRQPHLALDPGNVRILCRKCHAEVQAGAPLEMPKS